MCGRKYDADIAEREREVKLLPRDFGAVVRKALHSDLFTPNNDIRPTQRHIVIRRQAEVNHGELMRWSFQPGWSKFPLFNSRRDKLTSGLWKRPFAEQRCIVPVGGFYEWSGPKKARQPHAISLVESPLMLLAGLYVEHEGQPCYSVITTEATPWMERLHNREPVVIAPKDVDEYLEAKEPPLHLIKGAEDGALTEFACEKPEAMKPPVPIAEQEHEP